MQYLIWKVLLLVKTYLVVTKFAIERTNLHSQLNEVHNSGFQMVHHSDDLELNWTEAKGF